MQRFIPYFCAVSAATLLVVGCGSSSDSGTSGTGGSGGSAGSSSEVSCVGDYANLTKTAYTAKVDSTGKCGGSSDIAAVCTNDVTTAAEACGIDCLKKGGNSATQDACTSTCLAGQVTPALSDDCLQCYVTDVGCARDHCLVSCIAPASPDCADCRKTNGCIDAFYSCSGEPLPSAATGAAGSAG